jgi:hypothetical protein
MIDLMNPKTALLEKRKAYAVGYGYIAHQGKVTWFDANPGMFGLY